MRHNFVESVFLAAVDRFGNQCNPEELEKLISSETSIFDVLHDFFYHRNAAVVRAALEVYVRRSYTCYPLNCLKHHDINSADGSTKPFTVLEFQVLHTFPIMNVERISLQFTLPSSHPNRMSLTTRGLTTVKSIDDEQQTAMTLPADERCCQRVGLIAAFETLERLFDNFERLLSALSMNVYTDTMPDTPIMPMPDALR